MLTNKQFEEFRKEAKEALDKVVEKYGAIAKLEGIRYSDKDFSVKVIISKQMVGGKPFEQVQFEEVCKLFGLTPQDYNREVCYKGMTYNLIGFNLKAPKYPILLKAEDGKFYKWPFELLQKQIGLEL